MPGPNTPVVSTFPLPPPVGSLAHSIVRENGNVYWTPTGWNFIQILWAAIQGQGGVIDQLLALEPSPGQISAAVESLLAQQIGPAASEGAMRAQIAALGGKLEEAIMALQAPVPRRAYEPIIRFYGDLPGMPTAGQELFSVEMIGDEHFPAGLGRNVGGSAAPAATAAVFPISVNGSPVGSMNIAMGATVATWTMANPYDALPKDILSFAAPSPADATLSGPRYTFIGTRS